MRKHTYLYLEDPREIDLEIRKAFLERYSEEHLRKTEDVIGIRRYRNKVIRLIRDLSVLHFDVKDILKEINRVPTSRVRKDWAKIVVEVLVRDL